MRREMVLFSLQTLVGGCRNNKDKETTNDNKSSLAVQAIHPEYQKVVEPMTNNVYYTRHTIADKLVGPQTEVAKRYARKKIS